MDTDQPIDANELIDLLGGTTEVAKIFNIKPPSVSEWRDKGVIPPARMMYLRLLRPELFTNEKKAA